MDDEQNYARSNFAERNVTLFLVVNLVALRQSVRIVKDDGCGFEVDPMFGEIPPVLSLIELKPHCGYPISVYLIQCTYKCQLIGCGPFVALRQATCKKTAEAEASAVFPGSG
jgi:hypothetical protein